MERMAQPGPVQQRLERLARPASKDGTGPALQRVAERLEPALALEEAIDGAMQHDSSLPAAGRAGSATTLPVSVAFKPQTHGKIEVVTASVADAPVRLDPNQPRHFYRGGTMIA